MWQEIAVGLIIAAAALFIGVRLWRNFSSTKSGDVCSSCDCASGGEDVTGRSECGPKSV